MGPRGLCRPLDDKHCKGRSKGTAAQGQGREGRAGQGRAGQGRGQGGAGQGSAGHGQGRAEPPQKNTVVFRGGGFGVITD